jgi:hypothetical protein
MPSGLENLEGNKFILRYEQPWGGVVSNVAPEDLQPGQLHVCDGLFIKNGKLCSTNSYAFDPIYFQYTTIGSPSPLYIHIPITNPGNASQVNAPIMTMYIVNGALVAIDANCNVYKYDWIARNFGVPAYAPAGAYYSCSQMIRGIIYMFDWANGQQLVYQNSAVTQGTKFVGGKYCMTLDQYLVVCNTNMEKWNKGNCQGTPPVPPTNSGTRESRANRFNWSGANEAYTTFNPNVGCDLNNPIVDLDTGFPNDATAGFNGIPDVQQEITGCFAMGNVGYILHDTGVTQITPTSSPILGESSIQPFDTTLLWGGKEGIGCTMPRSLAVYGHFAIWGNAGGIYLFSGAGAPQDITGLSKAAIYADLNEFKFRFGAGVTNYWFNIYGQICNMGVDNNNPELVYNLYIISANPYNTQPVQMIVWSYVFSTQGWTRSVVDATAMMKNITGNLNYTGIITPMRSAVSQSTFRFPDDYNEYGAEFYTSPLYGGIIINAQVPPIAGVTQPWDSFYLAQYINDGITSLPDIPPVTNLTFRTEEFQIYRKPTIRGIIIRAAGTGTLHININGYPFSDIKLNDDITKSYLYRSFGMYTDQAPTININSTDFNGYITKVHAFGTYAEGEPL